MSDNVIQFPGKKIATTSKLIWSVLNLGEIIERHLYQDTDDEFPVFSMYQRNADGSEHTETCDDTAWAEMVTMASFYVVQDSNEATVAITGHGYRWIDKQFDGQIPMSRVG